MWKQCVNYEGVDKRLLLMYSMYVKIQIAEYFSLMLKIGNRSGKDLGTDLGESHVIVTRLQKMIYATSI